MFNTVGLAYTSQASRNNLNKATSPAFGMKIRIGHNTIDLPVGEAEAKLMQAIGHKQQGETEKALKLCTEVFEGTKGKGEHEINAIFASTNIIMRIHEKLATKENNKKHLVNAAIAAHTAHKKLFGTIVNNLEHLDLIERHMGLVELNEKRMRRFISGDASLYNSYDRQVQNLDYKQR